MWNAIFISMGLMFAAGMALTHAEEYRRDRWFKIVCSLPFAGAIGAAFANMIYGFVALFAIVFLAHLWKGNIASVFAWLFTEAMTRSSDSIAPDFRRAKIEWRDGNTKTALRLAETELNKNRADVEGLIFVAELLTLENELPKAREALQRAARVPSATDAQKKSRGSGHEPD
jgi:hypothetical protein